MTEEQLMNNMDFQFGNFLENQTAEKIYGEILAQQREIYNRDFWQDINLLLSRRKEYPENKKSPEIDKKLSQVIFIKL